MNPSFPRRLARAALAVAAACATSACASRAEVEELRQRQKETAAHIERLERMVRHPRAERYVPDPEKVYAFPIEGGHRLGPDDAWVTVIQLADFQCPACARVWPILRAVREKYPREVRLVFQHYALPIHARALPAALAAECAADQGKFWPMHDALLAQSGALADADLLRAAERAGVQRAAWQRCFDDARHERKILAQAKLAATFGVFGTPAFYVNGRLLRGLRSLEQISALVEQELARARDARVKPAEYFARMVLARGETPPTRP